MRTAASGMASFRTSAAADSRGAVVSCSGWLRSSKIALTAPSAVAAVRALEGESSSILLGYGPGGGYSPLRKVIAERHDAVFVNAGS
mgnify:CR=1 FL=1